jgi:pimeloyl-ACP methyl ester carboxylesterase
MRFPSGDTACAAWHYEGTNEACVIMAAGLGVTKEPGTDLFARRFHDEGFSVLAFDYRHFGESGGEPRLVARIREQHADWEAAIAFARTLPEVDPSKLAIWGFSSSGGHVLPVAARNPDLAAAIAQTPVADGRAATANARRYTTKRALLRFTGRAIRDVIGGATGREPLLVPLTAQPGSVAVLTTPDALDGARALDPDNRYQDWKQEIAARSALQMAFYRPGRYAARVRCPLLVVVCDDDRSALAAPAVGGADKAPRGELARFPGGHYAPFTTVHHDVARVEVAFLRKHLLGGAPEPRAEAEGRR